MTNESDTSVPEIRGGRRFSTLSPDAHVADPVRDVLKLRRRIRIGVYTVITADLPFYYFALGYTLAQVVAVGVIGWIIAVVAVETAFRQMIKLRKRGAYPNVLLVEMGAVPETALAAERGLGVAAQLLGARAAAVGLKSNGGPLRLAASRGLKAEQADEILQRSTAEAHAAMQGLGSITVELVHGRPFHEAFGLVPAGVDRIVFVPVIALGNPVGVIVIAVDRRNVNTRDEQLLTSIGVALGLSLENLRQRDELREGQERLERVVTSAPLVLFALDRDGAYTLIEGRGLDVLGIKAEQVLGRSVFDVFSGRPEVTGPVKRALAGEEVVASADFSGAVFEAHLTPVRDVAGQVGGVIGVATDISERRQAESALRASEERYRALVENASDGIFAIDMARNRLLSVNAALADKLGYTADELLAMDIGQLIPPDQMDIAEAMTARKVAEGGRTAYEIDVVCKDGTRVPLEVSSWLAFEDGIPVAIHGIARDISERRQSDTAIRESEALYRTLVETSPDAVLLTKASGEIVKANRPAALLLGFNDAEELTGKSAIEFVAESDRQRILKDIQTGFARGVIRNIEYTIVRADGTVVPVEISLSAVATDGGEARAFVAVARDVTARRQAEEALRESEEKYRDLVENSNEIIYTLDASGVVTYISPAVKQLGGYEAEEIIGRTSLSFVHPNDLGELAASFQRTVGGHPEPSEYRLRKKSGDYIWVQTSSRPIFDGERIAGLRGLIVDIDKRKRTEEALSESEERYRELFENASDLVYTHDMTGNFTSLNQAVTRITGYTVGEAMVLNVGAFVAPDCHGVAADMAFEAFRTGASATRELDVITKDGKRATLEVSARVLNENGLPVGIQGIARDITERKKAEAMIRELAYHDGLTGLPNRALFEDRLGVAIAQAHRRRQMLAVMFLDLDRFKIVNDTLGHSGGDKLLKGVADDLKAIVREGDTVARVGGDEFTLLLPAIESPADAIEVAERILDILRGARLVEGQEFAITTSIGMTIYPQDGGDTHTLLRNADTAMYRAKERGRDNVQLYIPAMNAGVMQRLTLENDLRHALERGELRVYYQPIAEAATGRVVATEALVRWEHPERGTVEPDEFIPFAEETGLIVPIGEWVLRESMRQNLAWQQAGYRGLVVGVNLSARQLQQEDMVSTVSRLLRETGLPPELLQLEITEGAVMKNVELIIAMLHQIRRMGIGISLDDFGTGYSSLSYLKRFPIDSVKIDRSFVRDIATDPNDAAIVTTVIAMARNLNLKVIAEGVETSDQLQFLRERGCDQFQGYLISKPAPAERIEPLLEPARRTRAKITRLRTA